MVYLDVVIIGVVGKFESGMSDSSKIGASCLSLNKFFFVISFKILSKSTLSFRPRIFPPPGDTVADMNPGGAM